MKKYITGIAIVAMLGVGAMYIPSTTVITNPEPIKEIVEIESERLDNLTQQALVASSTEIEAIAMKAYTEAKDKIEAEIALRVLNEYDKHVIEVKKLELEEKISF